MNMHGFPTFVIIIALGVIAQRLLWRAFLRTPFARRVDRWRQAQRWLQRDYWRIGG